MKPQLPQNTYYKDGALIVNTPHKILNKLDNLQKKVEELEQKLKDAKRIKLDNK